MSIAPAPAPQPAAEAGLSTACLLAVGVLTLAHLFSPEPVLVWAMGAAALLFLAREYRRVPRGILRISLLLGAITLVLLPFSSAPADSLARGIAIGGLMGLAGVSMLMDVASRDTSAVPEDRVALFSAITRSFAAACLWSPMFNLVSIMLALYPGLDWFTLLPVSLSLGCAALTIGMGLNWWRLRGRPAGPAPPRPSEPLGPALLPLAAAMGSFLALVIAVAWSLKIAAAGAIVMLAPLAAAAMSLLQATPGPNRAARGLAALRTDYLRLPVLAGEVTLFMAAGCGGTVIASAIPPAWTALVGSLVAHSPTLACLALMSAVVALSCMAVHPVLSVVLIASSFPPALLGLAPLPHLASILVGSAVASTVSPFSMISLMASRYSGLSVYAISVQTNRAFTLLCLGLAAILLGTLA